jgi:hypothetical protein
VYDDEQHVDDLDGHIRRVQENAMKLAKHYLGNGRREFARVLLAKANCHDQSKYAGIEWQYMHRGPIVDKAMLTAAIEQHQRTNDHHPEYWGGLKNMPEVCVVEMVCDWLARSQEFATDLREYVKTEACERFDFASATQQVKWIWDTIDILLPQKFAKR